jgi:predicted nuclease with TOPRIM domain
MEFVAFYAFVPAYDLSNISQVGNAIRIENDFMAWLGVMRRVNYMLKLNYDLSDLEEKSQLLIKTVETKIEELESLAPQLGIREYLKRVSDEFTEVTFSPLEDIWEEELRRLSEKFDEGEESS